MIVYRLGIANGEYDADGEDHDEWFGSLSGARRRRAELIESGDGEFKYGKDYEIDRVELKKLPPRQLVLAVLNRRSVTRRENVVAPFKEPGGRACPEGGEHEYSPDIEYDSTGGTINCEKCGETPDLPYNTIEEAREAIANVPTVVGALLIAGQKMKRRKK